MAEKEIIKKRWSKRKIALVITASILALLLATTGGYFLWACNKKLKNYEIDEKFVTVIKEAPTDGSNPTNHSALDNVAFLNYVYTNQPYFYSEMQGQTEAKVMGIGVTQLVSTYKQKSDDRVIVTEITSSSMVKNARQFCYLEDEIIWRNSASGNYNGIDTEWSDGKPAGHLSLEDFIDKNGLPASGFLPYVINEETLVSAEPLIDNGDATYTLSVSLDTTDKTGAAAYYAKQMVFNGDLNDYPSFKYINLSFTFDESWRIKSIDVSEAYSATMGVKANCTSSYHTFFEYDAEKSFSTAYSDYFVQYENDDFIESSGVPTVLTCLNTAFAKVLTSPTTFDIQLTLGETSYDGTVYLDVASAMQDGADLLNNLSVNAKINDFSVWLDNGKVYLSLDKIKAKLTIDEAKELLNVFLDDSQSSAEEFSIDSLLSSLSEGTFTYQEKQNAKLNSTLSVLGINLPLEFAFNLDETNTPSLNYVNTSFEIGDLPISATLRFSDKTVNKLSDEEKTAFIEIDSLVETAADIFSQGVVETQVTYGVDKLSVNGSVLLSLSDFTASSNLTLTYGNASHSLNVIYADDCVYLNVSGLKMKLNVDDAVELISAEMGLNLDSISVSEKDLLNKVFALDFNTAINLSNQDGGLALLVNVDAILQAFDVDLSIGQASFNADGTKINVSVLGVDLTIVKTDKNVQTVDGEDFYVSGISTAKTVLQIVKEKGVSVNGELSINFDGTVAKLKVEQGLISWANGLNVVVNGSIEFDDAVLSVCANVTPDNVKLAIGGIGVEVSYSEFSDLESSLVTAYNRIYAIANETFVKYGADGQSIIPFNPLPVVNGVEDILALLKYGTATVQTFDALFKLQDGDIIENILQAITLENNTAQYGVLTACFEGFSFDLYQPTETSLKIDIEGSLSDADLFVTFGIQSIGDSSITMPDVKYLTEKDFEEMIEYVTALVNTLTAEDVSLSVTVNNGSKQNANVKLDFHSGNSVPIIVNTSNTSISLSSDLFLHVYFEIDDLSSTNNDLYFDIWILDKDGDGKLDAIVQVSKFLTDDGNYKPLVITATLEEIMTLLSSAGTLFGLNDGIIKDWLVDNWLTLETSNQLEAIGSSLLKSLNLSNLLESVNFDGVLSGDGKTNYDGLLDILLTKTEGLYDGKFILELNSNILFGLDADDVIFTLQKDKDEDENPLLTLVSLENFWLNDGTEKLSVSLSADYSPIDTSTPIISSKAVSINATGLSDLLKVIGKSTTHLDADQGNYVLNGNFFIDGSVTLNLSLENFDVIEIKLNIQGVSVFVDSDGQVVINAKISYEGYGLTGLGIVINGDSTLDLTIKDGLIYMKRTQTSKLKAVTVGSFIIYCSESTLSSPIVTYRVVPLSGFASNTDDILGHVGYMFNLGDGFVKLIKDNIQESTATDSQWQDFGDLASSVISSYTYSENSWTAVLNGKELTDGVLDKVTINIGAENGLIKKLDVNTSIYTFITISANLNYRNPMGVMDNADAQQKADSIIDISDSIKNAMGSKFDEMNSAGWKDDGGNYIYAQGDL